MAQGYGFPEYLKLCNTRYGVMLANVHDLYISRSLLIYGEFSGAETDLLLPHIKPDDYILDIGANIGTHTLAFARSAPQGCVLAFEPQRLIFQTLCANVALNGLSNVMAQQQGLGSTPGTVRVPVIDSAQEGNFGAVSLGQWDEGDIVNITTVDALRLPRVNLMKIDVEGMEAEVIAGARQTITQHQPLLYVENDRAENSPALIRAIGDLGYEMWWHMVPYFRTNNFTGQQENIFGNTVGINMLCAPKARALTIDAPNTEKVSDPDDHPTKRVQMMRSAKMM